MLYIKRKEIFDNPSEIPHDKSDYKNKVNMLHHIE